MVVAPVPVPVLLPVLLPVLVPVLVLVLVLVPVPVPVPAGFFAKLLALIVPRFSVGIVSLSGSPSRSMKYPRTFLTESGSTSFRLKLM